MDPIFIVAFVVSLAFSGVVAATMITYVARTWQLMRSERDGSLQSEVLDRLDQIETRLELLLDRDNAIAPWGQERRLEDGAPADESQGDDRDGGQFIEGS